jgi:hypothetical protein
MIGTITLTAAVAASSHLLLVISEFMRAWTRARLINESYA